MGPRSLLAFIREQLVGPVLGLFRSRRRRPRDLVRLLLDAHRRLLAASSTPHIDAHSTRARDRALRDAAKYLAHLRSLLLLLGDDQSKPPLVPARPSSDRTTHHTHHHHHGHSHNSSRSSGSACTRGSANTAAPSAPPHTTALAELVAEAAATSLHLWIIDDLPALDFEARKAVAVLFAALLRFSVGSRAPFAELLLRAPHPAPPPAGTPPASRCPTLVRLLDGYANRDIALCCGSMLRECLRHEPLAEALLLSDSALALFDYVQVPTFDVASDAFATLRDLLSRHRNLAAAILHSRYDAFFPRINALLRSENYITRRQSVKLLGELLLERSNYDSMTKYVACPENLKLHMNLLRDPSKNIQFEAFHVFKIFVGNPHKSRAVFDILIRNQPRLVEFLEAFHPAKPDDEHFIEEREYIIAQIRGMQQPSPSNPQCDQHPTPSANDSLRVAALHDSQPEQSTQPSHRSPIIEAPAPHSHPQTTSSSSSSAHTGCPIDIPFEGQNLLTPRDLHTHTKSQGLDLHSPQDVSHITSLPKNLPNSQAVNGNPSHPLADALQPSAAPTIAPSVLSSPPS